MKENPFSKSMTKSIHGKIWANNRWETKYLWWEFSYGHTIVRNAKTGHTEHKFYKKTYSFNVDSVQIRSTLLNYFFGKQNIPKAIIENKRILIEMNTLIFVLCSEFILFYNLAISRKLEWKNFEIAQYVLFLFL